MCARSHHVITYLTSPDTFLRISIGFLPGLQNSPTGDRRSAWAFGQKSRTLLSAGYFLQVHTDGTWEYSKFPGGKYLGNAKFSFTSVEDAPGPRLESPWEQTFEEEFNNSDFVVIVLSILEKINRRDIESWPIIITTEDGRGIYRNQTDTDLRWWSEITDFLWVHGRPYSPPSCQRKKDLVYVTRFDDEPCHVWELLNSGT